MPEFVALDEAPALDDDAASSSLDDGDKVACPECGEPFSPRGIKRHITMSHRNGVPDSPRRNTPGRGRVEVNLALRWQEFQQGAALLVSLACGDCAKALVEDAAIDGAAVAAFCSNRPKLRKQLEDALASMDFMLLVGALAQTAMKMVSHHSVGKRIGLGSPDAATGGMSHGTQHNAAERMMGFLGSMPQEQRNELLNKVFEANRQAPQAPAPAATPEYDFNDTAAAGAEPTPEQTLIDEHDAAQVRAAHAGTPFAMAGM